MKAILREPLVHFLLLGAALFMVHGLFSKGESSNNPAKIVVTQGQIERLISGFSKAWQRPPSPDELAGLVKDFVREEVYCREAVAIGLDKDDTVIRRRLRQKMEFVCEDVSALGEPTEADLTAYLEAHPDAFRIEPRFTFRQVYLKPGAHGEGLLRDTAELLAKLNAEGAQADLSTLGDPSLLEQEYVAVSASEVARQFGEKFATRLGSVTAGRWQGPVESGFGLHLILVSQRMEGRLPALAEVREAVRRDFENDRRQRVNEQSYQELLKRYVVTVEPPATVEKEHKLASARR